jgi:inosine/guanosine/xanthosine phosphorylase family protein
MRLLERDEQRTRPTAERCENERATGKDVQYVLAVVAGSGMGSVADGFAVRQSVPFGDIAGVGDCTVEGHRGEVLMCEHHGLGVMLVLGRRHVYEGEPEAMRHLLRWVRDRGVGDLVVASAAGSLSPHLVPGEFVVIHDTIDMQNRPPGVVTLTPESRSPRSPRGGPRVHAGLTADLEDAAWVAGVGCNRGTLACLPGPAYETPAEVELAQRSGAHVVTMSAAPEITRGNECGMRVAALAAITNRATGIGDAVPDHADVLANAWHMSQQLALVVRQLVVNKWLG